MKIAQYKENLLNEFEARIDEWTFADFENKLMEARNGTNYQDAKGIIIDAHKSGLWPKTVKRYLLTNFKTHGNVSSEFNEMFSEILLKMTEIEKQALGIK